MASATARAPKPGNEKGRLAGRPFGNFVSNDAISISTTALRLQFLSKVCGLSAERRSLIASLYWGANNG